MRQRVLHQKTCLCGQPFTTSYATAQYCSKKCSAYFRTLRDGRPVPRKQQSLDEAMKEYRKFQKQRRPDRLRGNTLEAFLTWAKSQGEANGSSQN